MVMPALFIAATVAEKLTAEPTVAMYPLLPDVASVTKVVVVG